MSRTKAPAPVSIAMPHTEMRELGTLRPHPKNPNKHPASQIDALGKSFDEFSITSVIVVDDEGLILAGHARVETGLKKGFKALPAIVVSGWSEAKKVAFMLADNQQPRLSMIDEDLLRENLLALQGSGIDFLAMGFDSAALAAALSEKTSGLSDPDYVPPVREWPATQPGDLWVLGEHRLLCGDSTQPDHMKKLFGDRRPDCILTDPPYCSGGFQEAGRSAGSIGVRSKTKTRAERPEIANDKLSTRGYIALMKAVVGLSNVPVLYAFTDWRMWINLYDVAESSGYGVRNMIVWDKGTPGMGRGWRTQHELLMFAAKSAVDFDPKKAQGNVIASKRTGNILHPTQKPVDLIRAVLNVTPARLIYEPFCGSGSTLIACEEEGRTCLAVESSAAFVDVVIMRWQEFTGRQAVLDGSGETFDEVAKVRRAGLPKGKTDAKDSAGEPVRGAKKRPAAVAPPLAE